MKYIGGALLLLCSVLLSRAFSRYLSWQVGLLDGFIEFVKKMNAHTSSYLEPISSWIGEFECAPLEEIGLLCALRDGKMPKEAYRGLKTRHLTREADRVLLDFFDRTGTVYLAEELAAQNRCLSELRRIAERERKEMRGRARAFSALLFAAIAGLLLLLL